MEEGWLGWDLGRRKVVWRKMLEVANSPRVRCGVTTLRALHRELLLVRLKVYERALRARFYMVLLQTLQSILI